MMMNGERMMRPIPNTKSRNSTAMIPVQLHPAKSSIRSPRYPRGVPGPAGAQGRSKPQASSMKDANSSEASATAGLEVISSSLSRAVVSAAISVSWYW